MKKDARTQTDCIYIYMCLHSNPQKDRKVWHIVENQTPYTYQYHTADLFYLVGGGYTHTYIYIQTYVHSLFRQNFAFQTSAHFTPNLIFSNWRTQHQASSCSACSSQKSLIAMSHFWATRTLAVRTWQVRAMRQRTPRCIFGHLRGKESGIQDVAIGALHP